MPDALAKVTIHDGPGVRRYSVTTVAVTAVLLAVTLAGVVAVDPRAEYGSPLGLQPLVEPDSAAAKLALYDALQSPPSAAVIGSSRAMALPPSVLAPDGFNFAIDGGGLADQMIVYHHLVRTDPRLDRFVFTVDAFGIIEGKLVRVESSSAHDELTGQPAPDQGFAWSHLPSALSADLVRESLRVAYYSATSYPEPLATLDADGLQHHPAAERQIAAGTYDLAGVVARQYAPDEVPAYTGELRPVDEALLADLRAVAEDAASRGISATFILPPYEPHAYDLVAARPGFHDRVEAILGALLPACPLGIHVVDYSDGSRIGLDPLAFYDGHHPTPANGARILAAAVGGEGDLCAS